MAISSNDSDIDEPQKISFPWRKKRAIYNRYSVESPNYSSWKLYSGEGWIVSCRTWSISPVDTEFWNSVSGSSILNVCDGINHSEHFLVQSNDQVEEVIACYSHSDGAANLLDEISSLIVDLIC